MLLQEVLVLEISYEALRLLEDTILMIMRLSTRHNNYLDKMVSSSCQTHITINKFSNEQRFIIEHTINLLMASKCLLLNLCMSALRRWIQLLKMGMWLLTSSQFDWILMMNDSD